MPELRELDSDSVDGVDLVGDSAAAEGPEAAVLFLRTLGKGRPVLTLRLGVSMAKTWLRVETVTGLHCKSLKSLSLQEHLF